MFSLATKLATARTSGSAFNFISSTYDRLVTVICFPSVWDVWSCTDFFVEAKRKAPLWQYYRIKHNANREPDNISEGKGVG